MQHIIKTCLKLQYLVLFCLYTKNAFFLISFYFFIFFLGGGGILIIEYTPALQYFASSYFFRYRNIISAI